MRRVLYMAPHELRRQHEREIANSTIKPMADFATPAMSIATICVMFAVVMMLTCAVLS